LSDVNEAVLWYEPAEFPVVALVTCAMVLELPATVLGPTSCWFGGEPVTDQPVSLSPASVQSTSVPEGRLSVTDTPVAVGLPALVSVTRKSIGSPELTESSSAVFVIERSADCVSAASCVVVWPSVMTRLLNVCDA
jgi:hypothetical protein